ncbi:MAG: guanylate kinase [Lachnospiraceae bacterium]|nr:guanylate kinase [Lachnospiraceae bacterium]
MGKIFYIMGKSSSGKDTIYKKLLEDSSLHTVVMYTTRPIREGEKDGREYHFVKDADLQRLEEQGLVIEKRSYHTFHGLWNYFTVKDEHIDLDRYDYLMIGTLDSYRSTKAYFGGEKLFPIYIALDDGVRLQRALDREKAQENPRYQEMCRRFLADCEDFSDIKIEEAGIRRSFYNDDLDRCISEIREYMALCGR